MEDTTPNTAKITQIQQQHFLFSFYHLLQILGAFIAVLELNYWEDITWEVYTQFSLVINKNI